MRSPPPTARHRRARHAINLSLALAATASLAGCGDRRQRAADSALASDLAIARGDSARDLTTVARAGEEPELHDVSLRGASVRPQPASPSVDRGRPAPTTSGTPAYAAPDAPARMPEPAASAPAAAAPIPAAAATSGSGTAPTTAATSAGLRPGTVAGGTVFRLSPHIRVCTNSSAVGDVFEATLASSVTGSDGATIPAGANVVLKVTGLLRSGDDAVLSFEITAIGVTRQSYAVTASDAGGAVGSTARTASEIEKGAGHATAEEVARFGTCVPRDGELTVTLTRSVRLSASE